MTEETVNNGADAAPVADDLRSTITAAIERQRNPAPKEEVAAEPETTEEAETKAEADGRARDENGRFKASEKADAAAKEPTEPKDEKVEAPKGDAKQENTPDATVRPPPGWSPKSKAAFDNLPNEVKADIAKREAEVNQGFAKLAEYKPIERFADMARQGGTTLEKALTAYTNMENVFRRDPIAGVEEVCRNLGINPRALQAEMARRYGAGQVQQPQPAAQQQIQLPTQLLEEITGLKSSLTQLQEERQAQEMNATTQNVEAFFNDPKNKFADNVSDVMADLIKQAKAKGERPNLSAIYEQACWLHPEVRDLLINERLAATTPAVSNPAKAQVAADQARQAAKAVTGAPSRGAPPASAPPANESVRDTVIRAIAQQRGA